MTALVADLEELYRHDFYAWALNQAGELRRLDAERWNGPLDLPRLSEEVESLGREQRHAVESQLERLIQHLLKLQYSPTADTRSGWLNSVDDARAEIERRFTPTMRPEVEPKLDRLYAHARRRARRDLASHGEHAAADALPVCNPYSVEQLLDETWYPPNQHGLIDGV